jgi:subtilase family serine protease
LKHLRFVICLPIVLVLAAAVGSARAATFSPTIVSRNLVVPAAVPGPTCPLPGNPSCYTPAFLKQAYGFPVGPGAPTGAGQTIVIVVAYGSPTVQSDLAVFDARNGLPPANLTIRTQRTDVPGTGGSGATFVWAQETATDVEYAHAMAPGARIVLAVADTDDTQNMLQIETEVLPRYPGAIVTQSFTGDETGPASDPAFGPFARLLWAGTLLSGGTVLASGGDAGASNGTEIESFFIPGLTPSAMAVYPASDPLVLGVGGTEGNPYPGGLWQSGGYGGEQVWNEPFAPGAGGGAPSVLFPAPPWQQGLTQFSTRTTPDVSYNAAINGGVVVVLSCAPDASGQVIAGCDASHPHSVLIGGTSAGAPQWAGIIALANEVRDRQHKPPVGYVSPALYGLAANPGSYARDFHDITVGNNTLDLSVFGLPPSAFGFSATPGFDIPTGLGTPQVSGLLGDLAALPAVQRNDDVDCSNQVLTGSYHNVRVGKGQRCTLNGAIVSGNLQADHAGGLTVTGTVIGGNLQGNNVVGGANVICGAVVDGNLQVHNSSAAATWTIGGSGCSNSISGNLEFQGNDGRANVIAGNLVLGNLQCDHNGGLAGGGNHVGGKLHGDCAALGTQLP